VVLLKFLGVMFKICIVNFAPEVLGVCLGVKIYNLGDVDVTIEEGEKYAQIAVIEKPDYEIIELNDEQFEILKSNQSRGDKGFGSSGN
jgi:dUTPase